jgi:hypothetical protein
MLYLVFFFNLLEVVLNKLSLRKKIGEMSFVPHSPRFTELYVTSIIEYGCARDGGANI